MFECTPDFNRLSPVSIIPPLLHTDIHVALTGKGKGLSLKPSKKQCSFGNRGTLDRNVVSVASLEGSGLEVNADKTKYMVMSLDRNAGRGHSVKIDNTSIERVEEFKYLGTTITDQNSIEEEIKSRLKLGNACYHSV